MSYGSLHHGKLGIRFEAGGREAPHIFTMVGILALCSYIRKVNVVHLVEITALDIEDGELEGVVATLGAAGFPVWLRIRSPQSFPHVLGIAPVIVHITSEAWVNCPSSVIVYEMDEERAPKLTDATVQNVMAGRTALRVAVSKSADVNLAVSFIKSTSLKNLWNLEIPERWSLRFDLSELKDIALKETSK